MHPNTPITLGPPEWRYRLPKERETRVRSPVVAGNTAYVVFYYRRNGGDESKLVAIDIASGRPLWDHKVGSVGNQATPGANGTVYWSDFAGKVHAFRPDGTPAWTAPTGQTGVGAPCAAGTGQLVVAELQGRAQASWCLDGASGAALWRTEHGGHSYAIADGGGCVLHASIRQGGFNQPVEGSLLCLDLRDGAPRWSVLRDEYLFGPVIIGDTVFIGSNQALLAYDLASGAQRAALTLSSDKSTHHVAACSRTGSIIVREDNHGHGADRLSAFSLDPAAQFQRLWTLDEPRGLCGAPVALQEDTLSYLTHDGTLCLRERASGLALSETPLETKPDKYGGGQVVAGSRLIVTHDRSVFCFALATA